jgi:hypothetical protein
MVAAVDLNAPGFSGEIPRGAPMMSEPDHILLLPASPEGEAMAMRRDDRAVPEPGTARALWPTFMRRTLAEDTLGPPQRPLPPRPTLPEA